MNSDKELKNRLQHLKQTFAERYDTATAFGNLELIKISCSVEEIDRILAETSECRSCDGRGYSEHECDCDHCEYEGDTCEDCEGEGRTPNEKYVVHSVVTRITIPR